MLCAIRAAYHHHFEEGLLGPKAWYQLDKSIAHALDYTYSGLTDLEYLNNFFKPGFFVECFQSIPIKWIRRLIYEMRFSRVMTGYDCLINFVDCR
jgi:hypothetical protein